MAIYARCPDCRTDNKLNRRNCKRCKAKLGSKYQVKVKDPRTGKWRTKITPTLKLAKNVEAKFNVNKIEGNLFDLKKGGTISFQEYLDYAKLYKKSWKEDEYRWNKHVANANWKSRQGIIRILHNLKESGYQPASIHHILKLIRRVYNWHMQNGLYHGDNPCDNIRLPKYDNKVNNILSAEQTSGLIEYLNHWDNRRAALVTLFAIYTGRRKGEILSLTWNDVDLKNRVITCRNTKNGSTLSFPVNLKATEILEEAKSLEISHLIQK